MSEGIHFRAKSEIVELFLKEAYSRIPEGIVLFFPILQSTRLFFVEIYVDTDNMKDKAVLTWLSEGFHVRAKSRIDENSS